MLFVKLHHYEKNFLIVAFIFAALFTLNAQVSSIRVDSAFADKGFSMHEIINGTPDDMAWQSNGKMIWTGGSGIYGPQIFVGRLNTDGTIDSSFGTNGFYIIQLTGYPTKAISLHVWNNDNITCIYRYTISQKTYLCVLRLLPNGTPDSTFGTSGVSTINITALGLRIHGYNNYRCYVFNNDGSIFAGLSALLKIKPNGIPDSTFVTNGVLTLDSLSHIYSFISSLEKDTSGNLLVAGPLYYDNGVSKACIYNITPQGNLVSNFGTNGMVVYSQLSEQGFPASNVRPLLQVRPNGKIIVGGPLTTDGGYFDEAYIQLLPNGQLDKSFGNEGFVAKDRGSQSFDSGLDFLTLLDDGRIINLMYPSSQYKYSASSVPKVYSLLPNGSIDSSVFYDYIYSSVLQYGILALPKDSGSAYWVYSIKLSPDMKYIYIGVRIDGNNLSPKVGFVRLAISDIAASIQGLSAAQRVKLFPNPANHTISLQCPVKTAPERISLHSIDGKLLSVPFQRKSDEMISADVSGLQPGIYFIYSPGWETAVKLVVEK